MVGILSGRRYAVGVALAVLFLFACTARLDGQAPATKVDRIVIEKSKRQMMLMSGGKAVKRTKSHLAQSRSAPSNSGATIKLPKESTQSTQKWRRASFIGRCIFHIPARRIASGRARWE
jgi:hypothetical protein